MRDSPDAALVLRTSDKELLINVDDDIIKAQILLIALRIIVSP